MLCDRLTSPSQQPATATAAAAGFATPMYDPRRKPSRKTATSSVARLLVNPGPSGSDVTNQRMPATGVDEDGLPPPLKAQRTEAKDTSKSDKTVLSVSSRRAVHEDYAKKGRGSVSALSLPNPSPLPSDTEGIHTRSDTAVEQATSSDPKRRDAKLRPVNAARPPNSKRKLLTDDGEDLPGE